MESLQHRHPGRFVRGSRYLTCLWCMGGDHFIKVVSVNMNYYKKGLVIFTSGYNLHIGYPQDRCLRTVSTNITKTRQIEFF